MSDYSRHIAELEDHASNIRNKLNEEESQYNQTVSKYYGELYSNASSGVEELIRTTNQFKQEGISAFEALLNEKKNQKTLYFKSLLQKVRIF